MHSHMKYLLTLSQFFGLLPVNGIFNKNPEKLKFNLNDKRTIYSVVCGLMLMIVSFFAIYYSLTHNLRLRHICMNFILPKVNFKIKLLFAAVALFYTNAFLSNVAFLRVAKQWPNFAKDWYKLEKSMKHYEASRKLKFRINVICLVFLLLVSRKS